MIIPFLNLDLGLSGLITGASGTVAGLWQNYQNNKMMQKQMDYNTKEREASQAYNTSEREASQAYQTSEREAQNKYSEEMYNKYSSPQAMVDQYKKAGLNPRLAANGEGLGTSVSGGSSGGAPSGAAPSGTHINPPYQNMSAMSDSFASMAKGLTSIAEAKKAGVETDFLEDTYKSRIAQVLKNEALQDLEIEAKALGNKNAQKAFKKLEVEIQKEHMNLDFIEKQLDILDKEGAIKGYEKETWKERFKNEQENVKADTASKNQGIKESDQRIEESKHRILNIDADTVFKRAQTATEKTKPALNRALTSFHQSATRLNSLEYQIRNASSVEEKKAKKKEFENLYNKLETESHYILTELDSLKDDPGTLGEFFETGNLYGFVARAVLEAKNLIKFW